MKRIITCSDGTWNKPNELVNRVITPTNVWKLYDLIAPNDDTGEAQVKFYDEGVGTNWYDHLRGGILGMGINQNIIQAYQYIAKNYEQDDEIYLIGFSRGAYTARSVAGFIRNSGLLHKEYAGTKLKEAFLLYKRRDDKSMPDSDEALAFKKKYCFDNVRIKFIGVWDTVGELGIPLEVFDKFNRKILDCRFHDVQLSSYVDYAYHAVAIDEHRKPFLPTLWEQQKGNDVHQVMEQMWYTGAHRDVGGGYNECGLSDCALKWMIEKAENVGLKFKDDSAIIPNPLDKIHNSMSLFYEIFGSKDRKMGNGPEYNEILSPAAKTRWNTNTENYRNTANPNIQYFKP